MATSRDISTLTGQITAGLDYKAEPVRTGLITIAGWFADATIGNADIAAAAAIVSTKLKHQDLSLYTFLNIAHAADGSLKRATPGVQGLVVSAGSTPSTQVSITATYITVADTNGNEHLVGVDESGNAEIISEEITEGATGDSMATGTGATISTFAANTTYTILCLRDAIGTYITKFVFYDGSDLDSTFYTDLGLYNTAQSSAYTHAAIVGAVFADADGNLEIPRPIGGGSSTQLWLPSPAQVAIGSYPGDSSTQDVTGLGLTADLIFIAPGHTAHDCRIWVRGMTSTYSKGVGDATSSQQWATTAITAVEYDQFTVGDDASVNATGVTYYFFAIKIHR